MAYIWDESPVAKINAKFYGDDGSITIDGVTPNSNVSPSQASVEINKLLDIAGKAVVAQGMKRTREENAYFE